MASKKGRGGKRKHVYRRPKDQPGAAFPGSHHCPDCGKWCYRTRTDAETAAQQLHPGVPMRFYKCLPAEAWWHFTSMSADQMGAIRARQAVVTEEAEDSDGYADDSTGWSLRSSKQENA